MIRELASKKTIQWYMEENALNICIDLDGVFFMDHSGKQHGVRFGSIQELEACCKEHHAKFLADEEELMLELQGEQQDLF